MCVIAEKKLQLNSASLYVVVISIIGGILIGGGPGPPEPPPGYVYGDITIDSETVLLAFWVNSAAVYNNYVR